jgi:DNA polymerase (family 10)
MSQLAVAAALEEVATLMALLGENDFRSRAYSNAARAVEGVSGDLGRLAAAGKLATVRGLGSGMTEKVVELLTTGRMAYLEELQAKVPAGVRDLLRVNGLGPKKARALWDAGIDDLAKLKAGCESNAVAALKGFGDKTQLRILQAVRYLDDTAGRARLDKALPMGEWLVEQVRKLPGVTRAELAGDVRRRCDTAGGLDVVAATSNPTAAVAGFASLPGMADGRLSFELRGKVVKLPARLTTCTEAAFARTLLLTTGSPAHLAKLQERGEPADAADEPAVYDALGLNWIPPELREGTDELDLSAAGELPELVEATDIRGVFHNHTTASDGLNTLEEMALAAKALGYEYLGIGDHSQSLQVANGLTPHRVRQQWAEIDALNARLTGLRVIKGTECDILPDGSLDFDDELLSGFEYVVGSVHTHFTLSEKDQTDRVCKALAHPRLTMRGHPTGRLLLRRAGYPIDLDRVVRTAADHGKMIEINAQPNRLDLDATYCRLAQKLGVPLVINPDAHDTGGLGLVPWGVYVARRAGLTRADVFNTRPLPLVLRELARRRAG